MSSRSFVSAIEKLDWPKNKLDVMLPLEEDDRETIYEIGQMRFPICENRYSP